MKAIILSAGKGLRVRELNQEVPKVLLEIMGKPLIVWNIELLKKHGIRDIAVNTHYLANRIKDYLKDGSKFGVKITYSYEKELLGTAGALNNFREFFDGSFVVIYGDVISQIDLGKLIEFHKNKNASATLVVHKTDHPEDSDVVQINKDKRVIKLIHKPINKGFGVLGNAALYVLEQRVFDYLPECGRSDFVKDIFKKMLEKREIIYGYKTAEFIKDAGTPDRIKKVEQYLKEHNS